MLNFFNVDIYKSLASEKKTLLLFSATIFILIVSVAVAACGEKNSGSNTKADATTNTISTVARSTTEKPELSGFGATVNDWNSTHEMAPGYGEGDAYLPMQDGKPKYIKMYYAKSRVQGYTINFPRGTNIEQAKLQVMSELPSDASVSTEKTEQSCHVMVIQSPTLQHVLDGQVVVVGLYFGSDSADNTPGNIEHALFIDMAPGNEIGC